MEYQAFDKAPYTLGRECSAVAVDPSGAAFLTGSGKRVQVFRVADGGRISDIRTGGYVMQAVFAAGGVQVVVLDTEGGAQIFDGVTGAVLTPKRPLGGQALCYAAPSESIFLASEEGVRELDARTLEPRRVLVPGPVPSRVRSMTVTRDGSTLHVSLDARVVRVDVRSAAIVGARTFEGSLATFSDVSADGRSVVTAVTGVWQGVAITRDGAPGPVFELPLPRGIQYPTAPVALSAETQQAAAAVMAQLNLDPALLKTTPAKSNDMTIAYETRPLFSPRGDVVATALRDGRLALLDGETLSLLGVYDRRPGLAFVESLAWLPDGSGLVIGSAEGRAAIISIADGRTSVEVDAFVA